MNYRASFKYHVLNCADGRITHSTNDYQDAIDKANNACKNGAANSNVYHILETKQAIRPERVILVEDFSATK